jgi:hypothetical protein
LQFSSFNLAAQPWLSEIALRMIAYCRRFLVAAATICQIRRPPLITRTCR